MSYGVRTQHYHGTAEECLMFLSVHERVILPPYHTEWESIIHFKKRLTAVKTKRPIRREDHHICQSDIPARVAVDRCRCQGGEGEALVDLKKMRIRPPCCVPGAGRGGTVILCLLRVRAAVTKRRRERAPPPPTFASRVCHGQGVQRVTLGAQQAQQQSPFDVRRQERRRRGPPELRRGCLKEEEGIEDACHSVKV